MIIAMGTFQPGLAFHDVTMDFAANGRRVRALASVRFDVEAGQFVSIVGPTGCGKTTLLRLAAGLFQPTAGSVFLDRRAIEGPSRKVALVFQRPVLLPWRTVGQNLSFPCELVGLPLPKRQTRIEELLDVAELRQYRDAYPREISGGMQQIVSLCMALMLDPDLLLMDEPFSALDAMTKEQIWGSFLDLWSTYHKTVLFVTHSIPEAVFLSDVVIIMSDRPGSVIELMPIPLSRPRQLHQMEDPSFLMLTSKIRRALQKGRKSDEVLSLVDASLSSTVSRNAAAEFTELSSRPAEGETQQLAVLRQERRF
jgi:NitT/TauT family transport system ATP-binding protein